MLWVSNYQLQVEAVPAYAPTALINAQTNITGNQWDLDVVPVPSGYSGPSGFAVGDKVRVRRAATATLSEVAGQVDAVSSGTYGTDTIQVTFEAVWTPSSHKWELVYGPATVALATAQKERGFFAGTDGLINYSSGDSDAKRLVS
jgi:hypothetical protein